MRYTPIILATIAGIVLTLQPVVAANQSDVPLQGATREPPNPAIRQNELGAAAPTAIPGSRPAGRPAQPGRGKINLPQRDEVVSLYQIKEICAYYDLNALWAKIAKDPPARPFKSDGCSLWFNKWREYDLYPACFRHDLKYWAGYPGEDVERLVADSELMIDVARIMGSIQMAETMFAGVRVGGGGWTRASFAWGFGRMRP
ncbi:MAG: phospholipase [Desulfobulbus sp.]|nr:phospholipase [Desulfobulbus sp.]